MDYIPPPTWPPSADWPPPNDDWRPPYARTPQPGLPITPDGGSYIVPPAPGAPAASSRGRSEEEQEALQRAVATRMVAIWAGTTMSTAHSYYQAALKAAWTHRAIEHGEDWSPPLEQLSRALDQVWVRGYQLVTAAYQMERWRQAYEGEAGAEEVENLRALRNSLEHLDGARFSEFKAHRGSGKDDARSIKYLPGQELFMGFHASFTTHAFGVVSLAEVTERARPYLYLGEASEPDWPDE